MPCSCAEKADNLSAVLYGVNDMRLEQRPRPVAKEDEVLLRMEVVGICGSDVHYLVDGEMGPFVVKDPMVIGHEASGTVAEVGKKVTCLVVGDRVAIEPGVPCRVCSYCKEGRYNLCELMKFCATPPYDGNLSRFFAHPADFCYKLPEHLSLEEGALLEPLAVAVHACKRGKIGIRSVVLILGAGPIGLCSLLSAKAYGASKVMITDIVQHRLDMAKDLGADDMLLVEKDAAPADVVATIIETLGGEPTHTIDCCGAAQAVCTALLATKAGGVALLIGMGYQNLDVPLASALFREVDIVGGFRYVNDYPEAMELVASGKVNVKSLITHHYTLEETLDAFETAKSGEGDPVKIVIHANPKWTK